MCRLQFLPTPQANLSTKGGPQDPAIRRSRRQSVALDDVISLLPTPKATDGRKGSPNNKGSAGDLTLPSAAAQLSPSEDAAGQHALEWGLYAAAIRRWEAILGRPVPAPMEPGKRSSWVLSPRLVEWMMGYPDGHVTGLELSRVAMLRLLGNGVVPHQARAAFRVLMARGDGDEAERNAAMSVRITL